MTSAFSCIRHHGNFLHFKASISSHKLLFDRFFVVGLQGFPSFEYNRHQPVRSPDPICRVVVAHMARRAAVGLVGSDMGLTCLIGIVELIWA